jgi:hypothetical protein
MPRPRLFADEAEPVTVSTLRPGDFLVEFVPQRGIAGRKVDSGIVDLVPTWEVWGERGYGRRLMPVEAMRMRTLSGLDLCLPSTHTVLVRRKLTGGAA